MVDRRAREGPGNRIAAKEPADPRTAPLSAPSTSSGPHPNKVLADKMDALMISVRNMIGEEEQGQLSALQTAVDGLKKAVKRRHPKSAQTPLSAATEGLERASRALAEPSEADSEEVSTYEDIRPSSQDI